jgi:succinate dehydrogenase/fumarate reductase flavoprotein subunit
MMKDTRGGVMTQRRRLLAGAGLAAVPGRLLAAGAPDTLDPGASGVWDVIVAGSGAAGLSAAAAALESGAGRVLVLEKGPLVGGHSIYSSGSVSAVAPSRSHDPNDTLGRFVEDALEVGGGTGDAAVLAKIGEDSAGVLDWLESLGVFWSEPFIAYSGKQAKSYAMPGNSAGRSYVLALMAHLRRFGCRLALSTPVTGFRPEGHAWVVEVKSPQGARTLRTRSLVIACGGFTANVEARMKINPLLTPDVPTSANPAGTVFDGATGELIECAGRNGAFVTTGFGLQALPFWGGRLLDYQGADIYVDMHGRRFVNENSPWNVISNAILSLPERRCWVITDDRSFKGATLGVKLINGVVRKSDSIDAMAAAMDIEPVVLARTIEDYNRAADKGFDARTGKRLFRQRIERPPFYWGAERIYVHTTLDGIRTNRAAEVIASSGGLVPGLYAAGECAGGIFGGDRLGGAGMTACFVMGREAGRQAAARAKELQAAA